MSLIPGMNPFKKNSKSSLNRKQTLYRKFPIVLASFIFYLNCANVQGPPGGPEDKKPPNILSVKPEGGSVNVPVDTEFEIVFSKSMNEQSSENAVFISPLFFNYPKYKWSGKKLKVIPPEPLRDNTTYVLTIGALAQDSRGNTLGESMSYPFSTGREIYRCSIFGEVLGKKAQKLNVWAYKLESENPDSFWMKIPDYVTQPDSLGRFKFEYLSYGVYLVVAVEDKNSDQFWAPPGEKLGLPDRLVRLNTEGQQFGPMVMMATDRDTLRPFITTARSADNKSLSLTFSQAMDSSSLFGPDHYLVYAPDDPDHPVVIEIILPLSTDNKSVYLRCHDLTAETKYKVIAQGLKSIFGEPIDTVSRFFNAGSIDTVRPQLLSIEPESSTRPIRSGFEIKILFSEPIDTVGFSQSIAVADTLGSQVEFEIEWPCLNRVILKPDFQESSSYGLSIDETALLDLAGNSLGDSLKEYFYTIASPDSFGQILGSFVNTDGRNIIVVVESSLAGEESRKTKSDGSFYFDRLFPGVYRLRAYSDENNNGFFDAGGIDPFAFAEPIVLYPDTINVRARWESDVGFLQFSPAINDVDSQP